MKTKTVLVKLWAFCACFITFGIIFFLFAYIFAKGAGAITWEFLTESPKGMIIGTEGGILPASIRGILISMALATGRAMGETMAVMMVMGNSIAFPKLLGKGETISALIAMEMGIAEVGSTHYSALYTAGLVLMLLLFAINIVFELLKKRLAKEGAV